MQASSVSSSSIFVQWGAVDCIQRNGYIISYSVQYGVEGSGSLQTISILGIGNEVVLLSLTPSTTYSIQVAAQTSAGSGPYSSSILVTSLR